MGGYLKAVAKNLPSAFLDVAIIALISLAPLLLGRLVLLQPDGPFSSSERYWDFLTNGQIAFYSMGALATMLVALFDDNLPKQFSKILLLGCIFSLFFLAILVGIDPTLKTESFSFIGKATLIVYSTVLVMRGVMEAVRQVDAKEARRAASKKTKATTTGLASRKGVKHD